MLLALAVEDALLPPPSLVSSEPHAVRARAPETARAPKARARRFLR
jgi:hypothetical protein